MTYMAMSVICKQGQNDESLLIRYKNCLFRLTSSSRAARGSGRGRVHRTESSRRDIV